MKICVFQRNKILSQNQVSITEKTFSAIEFWSHDTNRKTLKGIRRHSLLFAPQVKIQI